MSYSAMGYAQREKFGSTTVKAVFQSICFLMRDDELTVYTPIPTLAEYTECDERTVRKALQRLVELGHLVDTGRRFNNCTIWRLAKYEQWLARAFPESPDKNEGASPEEQSAPPQPPESAEEKGLQNEASDQPSQKCEGLEQAPSNLQPSPPIFAGQAPSKMSPNLLLNPESTKPARATRLSDWKAQARVKLDRAPERPTKDHPAVLCRGHIRFWQTMVGWYGALWLHQFGDWPPIEWIRLLNLWNNSGKWAELEQLIGDLTLDKPEKPPTLPEVEERFRALLKAAGPKFDEPAARAFWTNFVQGQALALAQHYGLAKGRCSTWYEIDNARLQRDRLFKRCGELVALALAGEKETPPQRRTVLEAKLTDELVCEMKSMQLAAAPAPDPVNVPDEAFG